MNLQDLAARLQVQNRQSRFFGASRKVSSSILHIQTLPHQRFRLGRELRAESRSQLRVSR